MKRLLKTMHKMAHGHILFMGADQAPTMPLFIWQNGMVFHEQLARSYVSISEQPVFDRVMNEFHYKLHKGVDADSILKLSSSMTGYSPESSLLLSTEVGALLDDDRGFDGEGFLKLNQAERHIPKSMTISPAVNRTSSYSSTITLMLRHDNLRPSGSRKSDQDSLFIPVNPNGVELPQLYSLIKGDSDELSKVGEQRQEWFEHTSLVNYPRYHHAALVRWLAVRRTALQFLARDSTESSMMSRKYRSEIFMLLKKTIPKAVGIKSTDNVYDQFNPAAYNLLISALVNLTR